MLARKESYVKVAICLGEGVKHLLPYILQGLILGGTAAVQPGPLQAYLLSLTSSLGWRRALPATFAPLISDGPILILMLLVLTSAPPILLYSLQIAGGLFLLYLAWSAFKNFRTASAIEAKTSGAPGQNILKAAFINLLSPNPYIFWATIAGPILISGWREAPRYGIGFLAGFYVALIGGFMGFVALFAAAGRLDERVNSALSGLSAVALFIFGVFHLGRGIVQLLNIVSR
jgi:threonine/homoserine/homoserine lactone efflux protein